MKRNILFVLALAALTAGCKKQQTYGEKMEAFYEAETRRTCPMMQDEYTTVEKFVFDKNSSTLYIYNIVEGELDSDSVFNENFCYDIREQKIVEVRGFIKYMDLKKHNCNFAFIYNSATTGKTYLRIDVTPEVYNDPEFVPLSYEDRLEREIAESNIAMQSEEQTGDVRLDSLHFVRMDRRLELHHTISGWMDDPEIYTPENRKSFRDNVFEAFRNADVLTQEKQHELKFAYIYHSAKTGKVLIKVDFEPPYGK